jgi:predicted dinucleotide-binding enzyme
VLATAWDGTESAIKLAGPKSLDGKVVIDATNPLDFSQGAPPSLLVDSKESLAEQIQSAFPEAGVVKTLNTMNNELMVDPSLLSEPHEVFLSGNDGNAKEAVRELLRSFGWPDEHILDLGDVTTARGPELYVVLWLRLWGFVDTPTFNVRVVR